MDALEQIKAAYKDGKAEINGNEYTFSVTNHSRRVSIFAYYSSILRLIESADFSFLDTAEFKKVFKSIEDIVLFDGVQLSKRPQHWEEYEEDFIMFVCTAMAVLSYPFMSAKATS